MAYASAAQSRFIRLEQSVQSLSATLRNGRIAFRGLSIEYSDLPPGLLLREMKFWPQWSQPHAPYTMARLGNSLLVSRDNSLLNWPELS